MYLTVHLLKGESIKVTDQELEGVFSANNTTQQDEITDGGPQLSQTTHLIISISAGVLVSESCDFVTFIPLLAKREGGTFDV